MGANDHGSVSTYINHKCRCDACRCAANEAHRRQQAARERRLAADPRLAAHGKMQTYINWGCRCRPCRDAKAASDRARQAKRRAG